MEKEKMINLSDGLNRVWWDITLERRNHLDIVERLAMYIIRVSRTGEYNLKLISWTIECLAANQIERAKNHLNELICAVSPVYMED